MNETVKIEAQIRENLQIRKTIEKSSASTEVGVNKMVLTIEEKVWKVGLVGQLFLLVNEKEMRNIFTSFTAQKESL